MARHLGAYTPPGGPKSKRQVKSGTPTLSGGSIALVNGMPFVVYGEDKGCLLMPVYYLHPKLGVLRTMDARQAGSTWKVALAKPVEHCPDCSGEKCSLCGGPGVINIPVGNTFEDMHARASTVEHTGIHKDDWESVVLIRAIFAFLKAKKVPGKEPGATEMLCPKCQAKKCPTCKGKGETTPIVWVILTSLKPLGRPTPVKLGTIKPSANRQQLLARARK